MTKGNNRFKEQTVLGIVTCNRKEMFEECVASIDRDAVDRIIVIVAGNDYGTYPEGLEIFKCKTSPTPVGAAKNILIREMRKNPKYQFHFLMEDDIKILNNDVFQVYIETALDSGLGFGQLSYALHGGVAGMGVRPDGIPDKLATVEYTKHKVDFYRPSFAAFTLFFSKTWEHVPGFDENYVNAGEHIHLYRQLYAKHLGLPMKAHADIFNSFEYLADIDSNHEKSAIRNAPKFKENFLNAWKLYKKHWGVMPHEEPEVDKNQLIHILNDLEERFAIKSALDN